MTRRSFPGALLGLGMVVLLASLVATAERLSVPGDGWTFRSWQFITAGTVVFDRHLGEGPTPIEVGDRLLAVEGIAIDTIVDRVIASTPPSLPGWRPGGEVHYTVERNGQRLELAVAIAAGPGDLLAAIAGRQLELPWVLPFFLVGLFVLLRRPKLPASRLLFLSGLFAFSTAGVGEAGRGAAMTTSDLLVPGQFWLTQVSINFIWPILIMPFLAHLFLVFPVPKRPVVGHPRLTLLALYGWSPAAILLAAAVTGGDPSDAFATFAALGVPVSIAQLVVIGGAVAHGLLTAPDPVSRAQIRWIAWGLLVVGFAAAASLVLLVATTLPEWLVLQLLDGIAGLAIPLSFGLAILRARLFDIDLVLNRTLVYGGLTAAVVALYVGTVMLAGLVVQDRASFATSLLATGVIAVVVQPARARLQRGVNRLMYGERDDPYAVAVRLARRLEATLAPDAVFSAVADTIAAALKLPYVAVVLDDGGRERVVASVGEPSTQLERFPLVHRGEPFGVLAVASRGPREPLAPPDRRLLEVLAGQIALAAHAVRLTGDLQRSRERLVLAREEERRRLRRDLHDGLGPRLAAAALKLDAVLNLIGDDRVAAATLLDQVAADALTLRADVRSIVDGLRPAALEELGLLGALRAALDDIASTVVREGPTIELTAPDPLPELTPEVEVAAYRIALEAVTNVVRHADARACRVRIGVATATGRDAASRPDRGHRLEVEVVDDGAGLVPGATGGVGLVSMRERATELDGLLVVESGPAGGTAVRAVLPMAG